MRSTRRPTMLVLAALVLAVAPVAGGGTTAAAANGGAKGAGAGAGAKAATAGAGAFPSVRLLASQDEVTARHPDGQPAGTMRWDPRSGHHHWHFEQFATYELWDATRTSLPRNEKQGFCLAPTDSVDLLLPRATWRPDTLGFGTVCGGESAVWIRETLPLGWGDTYYQAVAGQDFDVTDLPNGTYYIAVIVNPTGELHETDTANDTSFRKIVLAGTPGHRTVTVPAWHGIDDEGCKPSCG
jgi:Lysyl oxidase